MCPCPCSKYTARPTARRRGRATSTIKAAVHYWAAKNKCTGMQTDTIPGRTPENGRKVIAHRFTGGTGGSEVWLYEIVGGKHSWGEQDIDTGEELWKFFSKFVK